MPAVATQSDIYNHDHDHDHEYMVPDMVPVSVLPLPEALSSDKIRKKWSCLASQSDNFRAVFQTPGWCLHKALGGDRVRVAVVRDAAQETIGVAPLLDTEFPLSLAICKRELCSKSFRGLQMVGNQPLLPARPRVYDALFRGIREALPDCECLCLWGIALDSYLWKYLENSREARTFWQRYLPREMPSRHHWISLPPTFGTTWRSLNGAVDTSCGRPSVRCPGMSAAPWSWCGPNPPLRLLPLSPAPSPSPPSPGSRSSWGCRWGPPRIGP